MSTAVCWNKNIKIRLRIKKGVPLQEHLFYITHIDLQNAFYGSGFTDPLKKSFLPNDSPGGSHPHEDDRFLRLLQYPLSA